MSTEKKSDSSGFNTRWWESYLVRYFAGAVIGSICITILLLYFDLRILDGRATTRLIASAFPVVSGAETLKSQATLSSAPFILFLLACGLVYSYVISSPITVIHYGRSGKTIIESQVRYLWLGWVFSLGVVNLAGGVSKHFQVKNTLGLLVALLIVSVLLELWPRKKMKAESSSQQGQGIGQKPEASDSTRSNIGSGGWGVVVTILNMSFMYGLALSIVSLGLISYFGLPNGRYLAVILAFSAPVLFVGLAQYVTLFRIFVTQSSVHEFYRQLSRARILDNSRDIRETYTHLREHSNSTFIVLLAICFTAFLILLIEFYFGPIAKGKLVDIKSKAWDFTSILLMFVALWMTPNLFMWSRANQLELDFATQPNVYLDVQNPSQNGNAQAAQAVAAAPSQTQVPALTPPRAPAQP